MEDWLKIEAEGNICGETSANFKACLNKQEDEFFFFSYIVWSQKQEINLFDESQ